MHCFPFSQQLLNSSPHVAHIHIHTCKLSLNALCKKYSWEYIFNFTHFVTAYERHASYFYKSRISIRSYTDYNTNIKFTSSVHWTHSNFLYQLENLHKHCVFCRLHFSCIFLASGVSPILWKYLYNRKRQLLKWFLFFSRCIWLVFFRGCIFTKEACGFEAKRRVKMN